MTVRVLVVDDSAFFRRRITEILNADPAIEVVGVAMDGAQAIERVRELQPDVVTMDIEMPVMDGITAVRRIMALRPTPILMFSTLTTDGAKPTLDALEAGAADFLPKRFEDISRDHEEARRVLCQRVRLIGRRAALMARAPVSPAPAPAPRPPADLRRRGQYRIAAIGTSTGGPVALQQVLTRLPANFPVPLLLVQHMPATFTPAFAERLNQQCAISVKHAADGDALQPGVALLAPGGKQMIVVEERGHLRVRVADGPREQHYRPSVDITFSSLAQIYGANVLAVVMTGMGADGREGARLLKQRGATVWVQDEASCVVYGMPAAVADAGLADRILPLTQIGPALVESV